MKLDGPFYQSFVEQDDRYTADDRQCIERTLNRLSDIQTSEERPGMLLGKIQSGKTKTFLAIMALAFDNNFDVTVVLTKGTKALAKQTYERILSEFKRHDQDDRLKVFDIMTMPNQLTGFEMNQKLVLVVKKQKDNLNRLIDLFSNKHPQLSEKRILVVDDEADYASVGFKKDQGEMDINTTAQQLEKLRQVAERTSFLQVTATPYALYLQPDKIEIKGETFKPIRPAFTELVPVNEAYIGSDYYFSEDHEEIELADYLYCPVSYEELLRLRKKDGRRLKLEEVLTSNSIPALRAAVVNFIVGGCIRRIQEEEKGQAKKFSFLIHTEAGKAAHAWQEELVDAIKTQLTEAAQKNDPVLHALVETSYEELQPSIQLKGLHCPSLPVVVDSVKKALADDWVMISRVNSERQVEELLDETGQLRLRTPLNIFIGGQILDRGVTIANLIGFYYGRSPNVFQQDTVLQHSRMFGFRPVADLTVTRFYTEPTIHKAMQRMHESDIALRDAIEKDAEQPVVFIQKAANGAVVPCSPNKIALSKTTTLKPFKRLLPVGFQTEYKSYLRPVTENIDEILRGFAPADSFDAPFLITKEQANWLLSEIQPTLKMETEEGYDFDWEATKSALNYLANLGSNHNGGKVWCLVRTGRKLSRTVAVGSHAKYADAPDSTKTEGEIRKHYAIDNPMLILIRQNGDVEQGWRGCPFYWPVISAQKNISPAIFAEQTLN